MNIEELKKEYKANQEKLDQEKADHVEFLAKMEEKIPEKELRGIVVFCLKEMIQDGKHIIENEYDKYAELSRRNVPFQERLEAVSMSKIKLMERGVDYYERVLKTGFTVNSWSYFTFVGDEEEIEKKGLKHFIKSRIKYVINSNEVWKKAEQS